MTPAAPDRRTILADAAIDVVAQHGLRGLTHRAVDAAAGLPAGSASNHFRTRAALVAAVVDRIEARELAVAAAAVAPTTDLDEFLGSLARFATTLIAEHSDLARVRLALFVAWPDRFVPGHQRFTEALRVQLAAGDVADAARAAASAADLLDGIILHAVTVRGGAVPDADAVAQDLRRLVTS